MARDLAEGRGHEAPDVRHVLHVALRARDASIQELVRGTDLSGLLADVEAYLGSSPVRRERSEHSIPELLRKISLGEDDVVQPVDLLRVALKSRFGRRLLADTRGTQDLRARLDAPPPPAAEAEPTCVSEVEASKFEGSRDLVAAALSGELDPVLGRDVEIEQLSCTLLRRTKAHPLLIGDAGVGKSAIVEGFAQRVAAGLVPPQLRRRRVVSVSAHALLLDGHGSVASRLRALFASVDADAILFFDEVHQLMKAGGGVSAAEQLKSVMARRGLSVIGATTYAEYRQHIVGNAAFERRFNPIEVKEPDDATAREILEALRAPIEDHFGVRVTPAAIASSVELSRRYIPDRQLPDKAIDVLEDAAARQCHLGEVASVGPEDVAAAVAHRTGVPVGRVLDGERSTLGRLESDLAATLVGQRHAVARAAGAIRAARAGVGDPRRPMASMLFVGPTGIGKSELARQIATVLFGSEDALVRIDMSELKDGASHTRLVGAPPGYVGYESGGALTEAVRRRPYSVVLFDEVEKAHADIHDLLLQVTEDGRLTDGLGRTVDFSNTFVILTSNAAVSRVEHLGLAPAERRAAYAEALRDELPSPLLGRLETVVFDALDDGMVRAIARREIDAVVERVRSTGREVEFDEALVDLVASGFYPARGARSLRTSNGRVVRVLTDAILDGDDERRFVLTAQNGEVVRIREEEVSP